MSLDLRWNVKNQTSSSSSTSSGVGRGVSARNGFRFLTLFVFLVSIIYNVKIKTHHWWPKKTDFSCSKMFSFIFGTRPPTAARTVEMVLGCDADDDQPARLPVKRFQSMSCNFKSF